jgi:hypothetical protein
MSSMPDESSELANDNHAGSNQNLQTETAETVQEHEDWHTMGMDGNKDTGGDVGERGEGKEEAPIGTTTTTSRVLEYLQEARKESGGLGSANVSVFHSYKNSDGGEIEQEGSHTDSQDSHLPHATNGRNSPAPSFSNPDDTPSVHVSSFWDFITCFISDFHDLRVLWHLHAPVVHLDPDSHPHPHYDRLIGDFNLACNLGLRRCLNHLVLFHQLFLVHIRDHLHLVAKQRILLLEHWMKDRHHGMLFGGLSSKRSRTNSFQKPENGVLAPPHVLPFLQLLL